LSLHADRSFNYPTDSCRSSGIEPAIYIFGAAFIAWTLLVLLSTERQRRVQEIEAKLKQIEASTHAAPQKPDVPVVG
jgi:hypothetical protein